MRRLPPHRRRLTPFQTLPPPFSKLLSEHRSKASQDKNIKLNPRFGILLVDYYIFVLFLLTAALFHFAVYFHQAFIFGTVESRLWKASMLTLR